jgi:hypothetical protein
MKCEFTAQLSLIKDPKQDPDPVSDPESESNVLKVGSGSGSGSEKNLSGFATLRAQVHTVSVLICLEPIRLNLH